jgi:EmrB/QacA subfamily drug resistance transporter
MPPARQWTLAATILGSSMTFIDGTAVNVALPALQSDLNATLTDIQWVIEAYALFLGSLILVGGSLGDRLGRKRTFLAGVTLFTCASIACGLSGSTRALIAGRAVQGIGAAFLVPGSLAILSATFDGADRGRAIGLWSGFSAITTAAGPVAGGWLIQHVSWRAVFLLNVPLAAIVVGLSVRYMSETQDPSETGGIDWWGAALATIGLAGVVFALLEWPMGAYRTLVVVSLATGIASLIAFVILEGHVHSPMLPLGVFRSRTFTLANTLTLLLYGALSIVLWLLPLNLIQVQRYDATRAGAALLPFPTVMFLLSRWSGGLVGRIASRVPLTIGPLVVGAGFVLCGRTGIGGSYWTTFFPVVSIVGLGMAIVVAPLTTVAMTAVETQHAGVASGINNAVARVAGLIAIAVCGIVLSAVFEARAGRALDQQELSASARQAVDRELPKLAGADVGSIVTGPQRTAVQRVVDESFVSAFDFVMMAAALVAFIAGGVGALIR